MTKFNTHQTTKILCGTTQADAQQVLIAQSAKEIKLNRGWAPCLTVVLVGEHPSSLVYVGAKQKACKSVGIESRVLKLGANTPQAELQKIIEDLNADSSVDGILIQLPLPNGLNANALLDILNPEKDVDGLTPHNLGLLMSKRPAFIPCTPLGCMDLITQVIAPAGKKAVVFGRSILVGRPMALLLEAANATVTIVHSFSTNAKEIAREADIVVAAIGQPNFITADYIKPGAVVIDVGMTRYENKLLGDVHESVAAVAGWLTPVPFGVGPMTITKLLSNTVLAALRHAN
ncbi:MAG: bifunctional 5,10-methylenetetrahydrofolate dehydrogenase/5,10-methenyltetrahydrofolate cyclohydrolase [Proteobacteria bacterium]|nr:bifunctional 5,10-methylenetetrahydrofolate dehydrogenase/5,10-methenyltetrahydrofolate cyclohydrolase [Pseudomonadota bacterium]